MKKIKPSFKFIEQAPGESGMNKMWEFAARLCYRSEDKMNDTDSNQRIYNILDGGKHQSPFSHATCYMTIPISNYLYFINQLEVEELAPGATKADYWRCPAWTRAVYDDDNDVVYVTTNYRVLRELDQVSLYTKYKVEPTMYHVKRYSVLVTADIGVTRELNRHAVALAINEQSTRYCDFSKKKHDGVTYIDSSENPIQQEANIEAEKAYMALLAEGKPPQEARRALNLNTASMALYTGFPDMWEHVLELRTSSGAHPDMKELMIPLYQEFKDKNILN